MNYTPAALELLVAAVDRADLSRRADAMEDMRVAMNAKPDGFDKRVRAMRNRGRRG